MNRLLLLLSAAFCFAATEQTTFIDGDYAYTVTGNSTVEVNGFSTDSIKKLAKPIEFPASVTHEGVTYNVTTVGEEAFKWSNSTSATLPSTVVEIKMSAFSGTKITTITLNDGLKIIGPYAFSSAPLTAITCPASLERIENSAFFGSSTKPTLAAVTLNNGLKHLGKSAFYGTCFESITIPSTVDSIGGTCFLYNKMLKTVVLNEGVKVLGDGVFNNCLSLESISLPASLQEAGIEMFLGCTKLTSINIPAGLTKIGESFLAKTGIATITVDPANPGFHVVDGCLYNINNTLIYCAPMTGKTEVKIIDGCLGVNGGAFWGSQVATAVLPESIVAIANYAFCQSALDSINFPDAICFVGEQAFAATKLKAVTLPQNFQYINDGEFAGCTLLTRVVIPSSIKEVYNHAFNGCTGLQYFAKGSKAPAIMSYYEDYDNPFYNAYNTVTVPKGASQDYRAEGWGDFLTIKEAATATVKISKVTPAEGDTVEVAGKQASMTFEVVFDQPVTLAVTSPVSFLREGGDMSAKVLKPSDKWVAKQVNDSTISVFAADADGFVESFNYTPLAAYCFTLPEGVVRNAAGEESEYVSTTFYYTQKSSIEKGDINADGAINVSDVTELINVILGTVTDEAIKALCFINDDDTINVSDVTALINIILAKS